MSKTLIILGAGLTGLPLAHYVLKNYASKHDLKVILVSRSDEFFWNIGAPRVAIPNQIPDEKVFYSIPQAFAKYPERSFEFVLGTVETWDPDRNSVTLSQSDRQTRTLCYNTIVVATGSAYSDDVPWKLVGTSENTHDSFSKLRKEVEDATSIVIAGAGPTGVEFAGELGYEYATKGKKKVTLIMTESLPLEPRVMEVTRQAAKRELEKLNVTMIPNARITDTSSDGKIVEITKSDGTKETLKTDLFVPTWGIKFNTSFAPSSLLEANGRLKVTNTLRAPGYDNAFLVGDAANLESYAAALREAQVRHLAVSLGQHLSGTTVAEYKQQTKLTMTVSVGRGRGVGQIGSWNAWSLLIWYYKGRDMGTGLVPDYVAGKRLILGSF